MVFGTGSAWLRKALALGLASAIGFIAAPVAAMADDADAGVDSPLHYSYADAVDIIAAAPLVVLAQVKKAVVLDADRTGPVRQGWARVYIEAETRGLLAGTVPVGEDLAYLADVKRDADGKVAKLKKREVLLFARPVAGRPGELQLVAPDAQWLATPREIERTRAILTALVDPAAPPRIVGVRDLLHTPGNLAGEGETQIFLDTDVDAAASITVRHRPGQAPRWGLSVGELVDADAAPPAPDTLGWYRLACALPGDLPDGTHLSSDPAMRQQAEADYAMIVTDLGACERRRAFPVPTPQ